MENDQAAYLSGEMHYSPEQIVKIEDEYLWKSLYSHSYAAIFSCGNCDFDFDIDGWFYKFETVTCPKCKTTYSGMFGKVLSRASDKINIETFEGEAIAIGLSSGSKITSDIKNHIVLFVFSRSKENQNKPFGIIDYSEKKPEFKLFITQPGSPKTIEKKLLKKNQNRFFHTCFLALYQF